ncbi:MAG: hypothetical protein GY719_20005 [bacterium]|nr:hypothetical protein [bacterium]
MQGAALADGQGFQSPAAIRQLLVDTGTPQVPHAKNIGPLPDLRSALDELIANQPPVAVDDWFGTIWEMPLDISFASLLANDSDPDGDPLQVCGARLPNEAVRLHPASRSGCNTIRGRWRSCHSRTRCGVSPFRLCCWRLSPSCRRPGRAACASTACRSSTGCPTARCGSSTRTRGVSCGSAPRRG